MWIKKIKNSIKLFNKDENYFVKGKNFNANYLIENLLNNGEKKGSIFSKKYSNRFRN